MAICKQYGYCRPYNIVGHLKGFSKKMRKLKKKTVNKLIVLPSVEIPQILN